jgi:hypothetical protein
MKSKKNTEDKMDYSTREGKLMPAAARRSVEFASAQKLVGDIPLRAKTELVPLILADSEFKQIATEELMELARVRKHVYTVDRASAIAVLKGVVRHNIPQ